MAYPSDNMEEMLKNLEVITTHSPFVYFILDQKGTFLLSRGKGLEKIGLKPDQIVGMSVYDLYGNYPEMLDAINQAYQGKEAEHFSFVEESNIYYQTKLIPITTNAKISILGISIDISDRKNYEDQLVKHERDIQRLQRFEVIGRLSSGVSHEFNNLLSIFQTIHDGLKYSGDLNELQNELLRNMQKSIERGKNITSQLLAYGRKGFTQLEYFDLVGMITDMVNLINLTDENKEVKVTTKFPQDKILVYADENHLHQILLNLILNGYDSIKKQGFIEIELQITKEEADEKEIIIIVRDNGEGIIDENKVKIFDPFFSTKPKGLGLGLSTTKSMVNQLGGRIEVESEEHAGTEFKIYLPQSNVKDKQITKERSDLIDINNIDFSGKTFLIIEDEESINTYLRKILQLRNAKVYTAYNGEEALELGEKLTEVDLTISDIRMPKMNGIEFYEEIKEIEPYKHLIDRIIFITGYADRIDEIINYDKIIAEILRKPFLIQDLFERILHKLPMENVDQSVKS